MKSVPFREVFFQLPDDKDFFKQFPDDDACLLHLMKVRYGLRHVCRKCDRESNFYRLPKRKAFFCQHCGDHVYPMAGTMFQGTHVALQLWFRAIHLFAKSRHDIRAKELERQLGLPYPTCWRMKHQIRKLMAASIIGAIRKGKAGVAVRAVATRFASNTSVL